jgi:catechol 2,3-dioxygenase-like lactoylglutathione lyase family enzyme
MTSVNVRRVVVDHLTLPVADLERSRAFYAAALAPLGFGSERYGDDEWVFGPPGSEDFAIGPGTPPPGGMHLAFAADSTEEFDAFHAAALTAGGRDNGGPGERARYHPGYYGAYVLDPDGNNVEAVFHGRG